MGGKLLASLLSRHLQTVQRIPATTLNSPITFCFMTEPKTTLVQESEPDSSNLLRQFESESAKKQLQLIPQLVSQGNLGLEALMEFLLNHQDAQPNLVMGKVYQALFQANTDISQEFLQKNFPTGVVPLNSAQNLDYQPLQKLLAQQEFQAADVLTLQNMCQLAGDSAKQRGWLYFTEVENFPMIDLKTINQLWLLHSEGKFGFSVQREMWLSLGKNFTKLWPKIGWKSGNNWTRYPQEFIWDLSAPRGHLPLSNQLRGSRVITSLLSHPAWSSNS